MPFKAVNNLGEIIFAWDTSEKGDYTCPHCNVKLIFVSGEVVTNHFRHKVKCPYKSQPESEEHLFMKKLIYDKLKGLGYDVDLEYRVGNRIADLYVEKNGKRGVIECQCTPIGIKTLKERTYDYNEHGVHVMWVLGRKNYLNLRIRQCEKYLKILYYGGVYYLYKDYILKTTPGEYRITSIPDLIDLESYQTYSYSKFLKKINIPSPDWFYHLQFGSNDGWDKCKYPVSPCKILSFSK